MQRKAALQTCLVSDSLRKVERCGKLFFQVTIGVWNYWCHDSFWVLVKMLQSLSSSHALGSEYCGTISGWFRSLSSVIRFLSKLVKRNAYSQWACTWQTSWSSRGASAYDCPSVAVLPGWTSTQNAVKLLTIILGEYHIEDWVNSTVNVTKPRCGKQKFNRKWFIQWPVVLTKHLQSLKR